MLDLVLSTDVTCFMSMCTYLKYQRRKKQKDKFLLKKLSFHNALRYFIKYKYRDCLTAIRPLFSVQVT